MALNSHIPDAYADNITDYCGVERYAETLEPMKRKYPDYSFVQCDLDNEKLAIDRKFDCVLMAALIEHLFNQKFVMDQVASILKPGGVVALTTPTPFGNDIVHRWGAYMGIFDKEQANDHIVIYDRFRFKILAAEVGLNLKYHKYFQFGCNQLAVLEKP